MSGRMCLVIVCYCWTGLPLVATPQQGVAGELRSSSVTIRWPDVDSPGTSETIERVTRFINSLQPDDYTPAEVQEFRFGRLTRDAMHLVATADFSGRGLFFRLVIVSRETDGYRWFSVSSAAPHLLALEVVDLDGDGIEELLIKELVGGYQGADTRPVYWTAVFNLVDGELRETSSQHREFYDRVVVTPLRWLRELLDDTAKVEEIAEIDYVLFKVRRTLGDSSAGLAEAIRWSHSDIRGLQRLAIKALAEIPGGESIAILERLSASDDFAVAQAAKSALAKVGNRP